MPQNYALNKSQLRSCAKTRHKPCLLIYIYIYIYTRNNSYYVLFASLLPGANVTVRNLSTTVAVVHLRFPCCGNGTWTVQNEVGTTTAPT